MKLNISIDDVSPHPRSSIDVVKNCNKIIEKFPSVKFTLFVPISYWRTMRPGIATEKPLQINHFKDFCESLRSLPEANFEIAYHGFYHGIPGKSDNDEMRYLSYNECKKMIEAMYAVVEMSSLSNRFSKILRPPAWRMSPESFDACRDMGIEILALSPDKYDDGSLDYKGKDKEFKNVIYFNVCPPDKPLQLFNKTEIVYHACDWDKNYLSDSLTGDLIEFIGDNISNIDFCFMREMID
tara:strand:- start:8828 stop:9544 length:717 start_codon:yes stop_codon:yes gene_type:complete